MAFGVFFDKFIKLVFKQTYIFVISKNKSIKKKHVDGLCLPHMGLGPCACDLSLHTTTH